MPRCGGPGRPGLRHRALRAGAGRTGRVTTAEVTPTPTGAGTVRVRIPRRRKTGEIRPRGWLGPYVTYSTQRPARPFSKDLDGLLPPACPPCPDAEHRGH